MMMLRLSLVLVAALVISVPASAQHDPGRNAVRELAKGNYDAAEKELNKQRRSNSPVDAAEKHFVRTLSACLQNDGKTALNEAKLAVQNGAQPARFLAGPKDILAPLYQTNGYAEWASEFHDELVHGPMIGDVSGNSAKVWLRTAVPTRLVITATAAEKKHTVKVVTTRDSDNTAVAQFSELRPDTKYKVAVHQGDHELGTGSFTTTPGRGQSDKLTIVFGGGAGFTPQHERMWTTVEQHRPDALFLLGDNIYIDDPTHPLTHHYCYYRRQSQPEWRSLVSKTPTYAIYDDHDFGLNDCIPGPFIDRPVWKRSVWEIFRDNWANPAYGGGDSQPGCWFDTYIGDVHFICLDCRYYRNDVGGTMIGPVQKEWLLQTLKESKGTFKVLASTVPWSAGVKPGSRDTWDGYAAEREEIFSFVETNRIDGVVLISADRHRVDIRRTKRPKGYDLYEFMSSRLTNVHTHGLTQNAKGSEFILGYNEKPAFARLQFDTTATPPSLTCRIIDIDSTQHHEYRVTLDQLRHQ